MTEAKEQTIEEGKKERINERKLTRDAAATKLTVMLASTSAKVSTRKLRVIVKFPDHKIRSPTGKETQKESMLALLEY
jgi:hypothetical protein